MHLRGYSAGFGLTFALQRRIFAKVGEIFPAYIGNRFRSKPANLLAAAVVEGDLEVHLSLAAQTFNVGHKLALIRADRTPQGIIVSEDGSESEGKNGRHLEAIRDHSRMIHGRLLVEIVDR